MTARPAPPDLRLPGHSRVSPAEDVAPISMAVMVRFLVLYDKPQDAAAFDRHYREVHVPMAEKLPGLRRYTVSHNPAPIRVSEPYYLLAKLDWDDMAALQQAFQSPEGQAARSTCQSSPAVVSGAWSTSSKRSRTLALSCVSRSREGAAISWSRMREAASTPTLVRLARRC